jgi:hypothetical protein
MTDFELAEDFLPIYDVSDAVATGADADRQTAFAALLEVDLLKLGREAPVVGILGALRMLPDVVSHLLHGETAGETAAVDEAPRPALDPDDRGRLDPARRTPGR